MNIVRDVDVGQHNTAIYCFKNKIQIKEKKSKNQIIYNRKTHYAATLYNHKLKEIYENLIFSDIQHCD